MKKDLIFIIILGIIAGSAIAQAPQSFRYQAVARDGGGNLLTNCDLGLRVSILQGSDEGSAIYSETHHIKTNDFGMINLIIGEGVHETGNFSAINWGTSSYYIKLEMDNEGGNAFKPMGTAALYSVPYALYAERAGVAGSHPSASQLSSLNKNTSLLGKNPNRFSGLSNCKISGDGNSFLNTQTGNVGIGTDNPSSKLEVYGAIPTINDNLVHLVSYDDGVDDRRTLLALRRNSTGTMASGFGTALDVFLEDLQCASMIWETENTSGSDIRFSINQRYNHNLLTRMVIMGNGNVGIGSVFPGARLEVSGAIPTVNDNILHLISNDDGTDDTRAMLALRRNSLGTVTGGFATTIDVYLQDAISGNLQWVLQGGDLSDTDLWISQRYENNLQPRMVIKANGNVGIGTTDPQRPLHVDDVLRLEPSDEPASPSAGDIYFDQTLEKLRCYDGDQWHDLW